MSHKNPGRPSIGKVPVPKKSIREMSNCQLGKHRESLSRDIDILVYRLAVTIRESKKRGLPSTGVMGVCECRLHETFAYHSPGEHGVEHGACWSDCTEAPNA
jgi:hypothetical protein